MGGAELYAANAAEMWASLAPVRGDLRRSPGMVVVEIPAQRATRVILWQPLATGAGQICLKAPGTHERCADPVSEGRAIIGAC